MDDRQNKPRARVGLLSVLVACGAGVIGASLLWSGVFSLQDVRGWVSPVPPEPLPMQPSPEFEPARVVQIILRALRENDETDAGIAIVFNFASPENQQRTGPMERFAAMVKGGYPIMLNFQSVEFGALRTRGAEARQVVLLAGPDGSKHAFMFILSRQPEGPNKGCWLTDGVVPLEVVPEPEPEIHDGELI